MIKKSYPDWSSDGVICLSDLNRFRAQYVEEALERERGELSSLEQRVMESLKAEELLSQNINLEFEQKLTLGERTADRLASGCRHR